MSKDKDWGFFSNPFLHSTEGSYISAMKISTHHDSALANVKTDTFFGPIYNNYHPLHLSYKGAYDAWVSQGDIQISETLNLNQLLSLLSGSKINQWDIAIQNVFTKTTPQYVALMAHHRVPFQSGKQEERIEAVQSLSTNLKGITALASVKTDVDNFLGQLNTANSTQKSGKTAKTTNSNTLENQRIAICNSQYATLGLLINHFSTTPNMAAPYFDLDTIRKSGQVDFTGHLKPLHSHNVCKHTFSPEDVITVKNTSTVALQLFLGLNKSTEAKSILPTGIVTIGANSEQSIPASSLGDLTHTNLIIYNPDANITAEWEVIL